MMKLLDGKTAIVTGAARGIGEAVVRRLTKEGANLILIDIDSERLAKLAEELGAEAVVADVTNEEQVANAIKSTVDKFGSLEILVNNAGINRDGLAIRMKPEEFDAVLSVNLKGSFLMAKAAARQMMKTRYGKIINMSSVVGIMGNVGQANYSASKGGLIALTKTLAKELGPRGIRVNAIAPGFIETDMTKTLPEAAVESFLAKVLLNGAAGKPEDIAEATLFLASPASDYITGIVLPVDGGMLIA